MTDRSNGCKIYSGQDYLKIPPNKPTSVILAVIVKTAAF